MVLEESYYFAVCGIFVIFVIMPISSHGMCVSYIYFIERKKKNIIRIRMKKKKGIEIKIRKKLIK